MPELTFAKIARLIVVIWSLLAIPLVAGNQVVAQDAPLGDLTEFVPADLKEWKIEFRKQWEGKVQMTATEDGSLHIKASRGEPKDAVVNMTPEDTSNLFARTRHLLNHVRIKWTDFSHHDGDCFVSVEAKGRRVEVRMHPEEEEEVIDDFDQAIKILGKYRPGSISRLRRRFDKGRQQRAEKLELDGRLPKAPTQWSVGILRENDKAFPYLGFHEEIIRVRTPNAKTDIPVTLEDTQIKQDILRKILSQYQVRNRTPRQTDTPAIPFQIQFNGSIGITVTCDRDLLAEMGVLDELDAYSKDLNRRLSGAGTKEPYVAPWAE